MSTSLYTSAQVTARFKALLANLEPIDVLSICELNYGKSDHEAL